MLAANDREAMTVKTDGAWLLLTEMSHRVSNELMAALSALRLASREAATGSGAGGLLEQAILRMENFGRLHNLLDPQRRHGAISERLEALCRATCQAMAAPRGIHITLTAEDAPVDDEASWTICVVASELMTNALKHAFAGGRACAAGGVIAVDLRLAGHTVALTVADNGLGAAATRPIWASPGFGTGIVCELASRIGGKIWSQTDAYGTSVRLSIPLREAMQ
jgi:two-component sensor histidine kinase